MDQFLAENLGKYQIFKVGILRIWKATEMRRPRRERRHQNARNNSTMVLKIKNCAATDIPDCHSDELPYNHYH